MNHDHHKVHALYRRLLSLYPRGFRDRFGESLEQTFNDLYREGIRRKEHRLSSFVLWIFIETSGGIIREHILSIKEMDLMKSILTSLRAPAIIGFILVLPLMILEWVNRRNFSEGFPIPLFAAMWLLPVIFILAAMPVIRNLRAGSRILTNPGVFLLRAAFLIFIAWIWFGILIDQMPCFLGVPNCD